MLFFWLKNHAAFFFYHFFSIVIWQEDIKNKKIFSSLFYAEIILGKIKHLCAGVKSR
jgi:hypothetical protein